MLQKSQGQPPFGCIKPLVNKWINYLWCRISAINCKKLWSTTIPMEMVPTKRPRGKVYRVLAANKNGDLPRLFGHFGTRFFMTEDIWPFVGKSFGSVRTTQIPRKTTMGITKKWCFSRRIWYVYTYIIYHLYTFFQEKTTLHVSGFHTVTFEKRTRLCWDEVNMQKPPRVWRIKGWLLKSWSSKLFEIHGFACSMLGESEKKHILNSGLMMIDQFDLGKK